VSSCGSIGAENGYCLAAFFANAGGLAGQPSGKSDGAHWTSPVFRTNSRECCAKLLKLRRTVYNTEMAWCLQRDFARP